jgi:hypothetical protein
MNDYMKVIVNALKQWVNRQLTVLDGKINNKVESVEGKALSTNDYTNEEKEKLAGIEAGATRTVVNGMTGDVVLTADDVGAVTKDYVDNAVNSVDIPTIPSVVSAFTNDAGYKTAAEVESIVDEAIANIDIPSGGGSSEWELVTDDVLTDDVAQLEYTDLDCEELRIVIYGRWNNADNNASNAEAKANILLNEAGRGYQYSGFIGFTRTTGGFHTLIEAAAINAMYPTIRVSTLPNSGTVLYKNDSYTSISGGAGASWQNGAISRLNHMLIVPTTSDIMLKAGSRIRVMKRG